MGKHILCLGIGHQFTMPDGTIVRAQDLVHKTMSQTNYTYKLILLENTDTSIKQVGDTLQSDRYDCIAIGGGIQANKEFYDNVMAQITEYGVDIPIALPKRPNDVSAIKDIIGE